MAAAAPLQILLFRHERDQDTLPYVDAIVRALQGGKDAGGYLATGEDLGIQMEIYSGVPGSGETPESFLNSFSHTLTLVFVDHELLGQSDQTLWDWLAGLWVETAASGGRHSMLAVAMDERAGDRFSRKREPLANMQLLQATPLGERAIRPAMLALRVLHESRLLLARALPSLGGYPSGYLRLFISHAKFDGLPLAHALKHQIETFGWLSKFYDAEDIPPGNDWQKELDNGVGSSVIVMLRTDAYDGRHWCRQEVLWSDQYATPAVLVDARTGMNYPAEVLPFDQAPSVRIPDGNLLRILFAALREGLRFLYFMRRIHLMKQTGDLPASAALQVFARTPGMAALLRACHMLGQSEQMERMILYPDPPLRPGMLEAAQALVSTYAPGAQLATPNTLATQAGGTS